MMASRLSATSTPVNWLLSARRAWRSCSIDTGTEMVTKDNAANFAQLFGWFAEGKLKPLVSQVYPLEHAAQAINDLGQRKAVGKVVVQLR